MSLCARIKKMADGMLLEELIEKLYDIGGFKLGTFTMRTGEITPFYIDMRIIWSHPDVVVSILHGS